MSDYLWREQPSKPPFKPNYAKKISLAWINWELNRQEERLQFEKEKGKKR